MGNLFRKFIIQLSYRWIIFKKIYLKRFIGISVFIFLLGLNNPTMGAIVACILILILLFISFLFADIHTQSPGANNPVGKMMNKAISTDDEYQSIVEDEQKEKDRKKRSDKLKKIING